MSLNHLQIQSVPFADWLKVPRLNLGGRIADILPLKILPVHFPSFNSKNLAFQFNETPSLASFFSSSSF